MIGEEIELTTVSLVIGMVASSFMWEQWMVQQFFGMTVVPKAECSAARWDDLLVASKARPLAVRMEVS